MVGLRLRVRNHQQQQEEIACVRDYVRSVCTVVGICTFDDTMVGRCTNDVFLGSNDVEILWRGYSSARNFYRYC